MAATSRPVAGQCGAGERTDEPGHGHGVGEECPLAVGPGPPVVEPAQQPDDALGVATIAERGVDVIEKAGPEAARTDGPPRERVDSGSGEPVPCPGGKSRIDPRGRWNARPPASLREGGRDEGAGQPGQQHRRFDVEADVRDPHLHGRVARGKPRKEINPLLVERHALVDEAVDRRIVSDGVGPHRGRRRRRPA